jgi:hypothetical protein
MAVSVRLFDAAAFERDLKRADDEALRAGAERDRRVTIRNIENGKAPDGGPQKANAKSTIKAKGHGRALVGKRGSFTKEAEYDVSKTEDGWALVLPEHSGQLAELGYRFDVSREVLDGAEVDYREALSKLRGSYQR